MSMMMITKKKIRKKIYSTKEYIYKMLEKIKEAILQIIKQKTINHPQIQFNCYDMALGPSHSFLNSIILLDWRIRKQNNLLDKTIEYH